MIRRARNVCFTLNNYQNEDIERLVINEDIQYIIYGKEVGTEGTPHLQGYCEFTKQYGLKKIKQILGQTAHVESRRGTQTQAIDYCKKDGDFVELGEKKEQGKRKDLTELKGLVDEGKSQVEVVTNCENFQQIRYVEKLFEYKPLSTTYKKKEVYWYYGPTGTGKTKAAYELIEETKKDFWVSTLDGSKWFNGYWGQPIALLDELRAKDYPYSQLLRLLDGYEVRLPYKGGFCIWNPDIVIITTPLSPEETYRGQMEFTDGGIDQLLRRIVTVKKFEKEKPLNIPTIFESPNSRMRHLDGTLIEHPERWEESTVEEIGDISPRSILRITENS